MKCDGKKLKLLKWCYLYVCDKIHQKAIALIDIMSLNCYDFFDDLTNEMDETC